MAVQSPIDAIEALLQARGQGTLEPQWRNKTAADLGLDSLAVVDLQLELETLFNVDLGDDVTLALGHATMQALAERIDALRRTGG